MAKKFFLGLITTLSIFTLSTLVLAQTTTLTSTSTTTATKTKPITKPLKPAIRKSNLKKSTTSISTSTACFNEKIANLTREMQSKKKQALSEYQNALKSATSTTDKREAKKTYNSKIKEINDWYYQELKQAKTECGISATTTKKFSGKKQMTKKLKTKKQATTTQNINTTSTSTATSTQ